MAAKKVSLLAVEIPDRAGGLAEALQPMAKTKVNLLGVVGYATGKGRATAVCVPECVESALAAAKAAGIKGKAMEGVLVTGKDAVGAGARITKKVAKAGINLRGVAALVVKGQYATLLWTTPAQAEKLAAALNAQ